MFFRLLIIAFLAASMFAGDIYKDERKATATAFCGGKHYINSTDKSGRNFIFHCKGDDSTISGVVEKGVLYTIYGNRTTPPNVQKVELLNPSDKTWTDWVKLTKRIDAQAFAHATAHRVGLFGMP
jgi:hypothetical protein